MQTEFWNHRYCEKEFAYGENPSVGGPKVLATLFSIKELKADFPEFNFSVLEEKEIELAEGLFRNGKGMVIRALGTKM